MKAVIMAGGEGTRLRPLTSNQPKPMVPVVNKPVIEHIVELVKRNDITDIVVTLQFLPQVIKNYFGQGQDLGVNLSYSIEETPLGTAGSVKKAEEYLNETFIVISGDALTDIGLSEVVEFHKKKSGIGTIALKSVESPLEFGVVITDKDGRIERFLEKPTWGEVFSDTINTGIYVLEPEVFKYIPKNTPFDFSHDLFPLLLKEGKQLFGKVVDGYWCDIGNLEQYRRAHQDVLRGKVKIEPSGIRMLRDIWVGEGAYIHPEADLSGPVVIGDYARIEGKTRIGTYSIVGNNVKIEEGAVVRRAVIGDNSYIGSRAHLVDCVVGKNCDTRRGVRIAERVVVGDECTIGEGAVINHDVKIYPFKSVDAGATINTSIIWESRGVRALFGKHGVSGLINIDITPALATSLAMAYGTSLKKDSQVVVSRDPTGAARMIKRAIMGGLMSTGIHVRDLRVAPAPVNRFNVHTSRCTGGIHVRVSPFDPQTMEIDFFDSFGKDIDEDFQRKVERYYYREDFRRAFYNEVGEIIYPSRTADFYTDGLLKALKEHVVRERKFKVVVDYSFGSASLVLPHLVGKLNCDIISLNAFTDEDRATLSVGEFKRSMKELSRATRMFKADFGVLIDNACEKIFLVDEKGREIESNAALLLFIELVGRYEEKKGKIALPLTVPNVAEELIEKHKRKSFRTKVNARALMEAAVKKDIAFVGAQGGGYIFPRFLPAFDGIMSFCKLLEYLSEADEPLSAIVDSLPECYLAHENAFCPWDQKGLVMRRLMERTTGKEVELLDGIKIFDTDRWVLIIPDPEEPVFRIYAEADTEKRAQAEVSNYISFINKVAGS